MRCYLVPKNRPHTYNPADSSRQTGELPDYLDFRYSTSARFCSGQHRTVGSPRCCCRQAVTHVEGVSPSRYFGGLGTDESIPPAAVEDS
jgi:hypothetical protein